MKKMHHAMTGTKTLDSKSLAVLRPVNHYGCVRATDIRRVDEGQVSDGQADEGQVYEGQVDECIHLSLIHLLSTRP